MVSSKNNLACDILKTLCYADIFEYPLTKQELFSFLIAKKRVSKNDLFRLLNSNIPGVGKFGTYYFLNGKRNLVAERRRRRIESKKKMEKARRIVGLVSFLPGIKFIGLSGSLSMNNSRKNDDIDLFIITSQKRLWTTRLLVLGTLALIGERRKRTDSLGRDKICLNMILSENSLVISRNARNLFTAHEVVQVSPLFNKNNTYEKFLATNKWVLSFLPNTVLQKFVDLPNTQKKSNIIEKVFDTAEALLFCLQYLYMKPNITSEIVEESVARFHPKDMKTYVLSLYKLKCAAGFEANFVKKSSYYSRILT